MKFNLTYANYFKQLPCLFQDHHYQSNYRVIIQTHSTNCYTCCPQTFPPAVHRLGAHLKQYLPRSQFHSAPLLGDTIPSSHFLRGAFPSTTNHHLRFPEFISTSFSVISSYIIFCYQTRATGCAIRKLPSYWHARYLDIHYIQRYCLETETHVNQSMQFCLPPSTTTFIHCHQQSHNNEPKSFKKNSHRTKTL